MWHKQSWGGRESEEMLFKHLTTEETKIIFLRKNKSSQLSSQLSSQNKTWKVKTHFLLFFSQKQMNEEIFFWK